MSNVTVRGWSLGKAVFMLSLVCMVIIATSLGLVVAYYSGTLTDRALERAVQTRSRTATLDLARSLHADWEDLRYAAARLPDADPATIRGILDGIVGDQTRVSWVGFARTDGTVVTASGGLLEGVDVSARPWFQAGLQGNFAGDVHDAVLLNRLLGGSDENPLQFIDLALPVRRPDGEVIGVLGNHISFAWAEEFLRETAEVRDLDLFLVSRDGAPILSTAGEVPATLNLQSLRSAAAGVQGSAYEAWPDGRTYFATVVPDVLYRDLPNFGWRLIGRTAPGAFDADRRDAMTLIALVVAGVLAAICAVTLAFIGLFIRPISVLAVSAERIADGEDEYPPEMDNTREAAQLSAALARLQSRT